MKTTRYRVARIALTLCAIAAGAHCSLVLPFDDLGNGGPIAEVPDAPIEASPTPPDAPIDVSVDAPTDGATPNPKPGLGIFALRLEPQDGGGLLTPVRVEPGDGTVRALGCARPDQIWSQDSNIVAVVMGLHYDQTDPSRASFVYTSVPEDAAASQVLLATDQTSCASPPRTIFAGLGLSPAFSEDGTRIAMMAASPSDLTMDQRLITVAVGADAGPATWPIREAPDGSTIQGLVRPAWVKDGQGLNVFWAETNPAGESVIRRAVDLQLPLPDPLTVATCPKAAGSIRQIGVFFFDDTLWLGLVLATNSGAFISGDPDIFLIRYGQGCDTRQRLFLDAPGSRANDMAVSPDGRFLAHSSDRPDGLDGGGSSLRRIWIGRRETNAEGARVGRRTQCSHPLTGEKDIGAHWVTGGTQLTWTRVRSSTSSDLIIADVKDGQCSNERVVAPATTTAAFMGARTGSCTAAPLGGTSSSGASHVAWTLVGLATALAGARRRRRTTTP